VRVSWCEFEFHVRHLKGYYRSSRTINLFCSSVYCAQGKPERNNKKYTNTVALPRTDFPLRLDSQKRIDRDNYLYEVL
jgi:hypothetical protein